MSPSRAQVTRMLALVPYLQGNDGVPINDVAQAFGVRPAQIRKDLQLLMFTGTGEYAGELIDFDLGALDNDGVIHIRDAEFMTRPLRITAREGAALIVALRTLRSSAQGSQLPIIDSALAKLETAVGSHVQAPIDVHMDEVDPVLQATIVDAISEQIRLSLIYTTPGRDEQSQREVDPRRLFTDRGRWYLEAWCLRAEDLRFFRLDRIVSAELTSTAAQAHDTGARDLADGLFTVGEQTPYAVVDMAASADWLDEYYRIEVVDQLPGGVRRVKLYGADSEWLRRTALRHAGIMVVREPAELAEEVAQHAAIALRAYDG